MSAHLVQACNVVSRNTDTFPQSSPFTAPLSAHCIGARTSCSHLTLDQCVGSIACFWLWRESILHRICFRQLCSIILHEVRSRVYCVHVGVEESEVELSLPGAVDTILRCCSTNIFILLPTLFAFLLSRRSIYIHCFLLSRRSIYIYQFLLRR